MIGRTAQRLRETATAIGDAVRPQDIPPLRLSPASQQFGGQACRSARWRGGRWMIPVVAAASVATLITGVSVAGQVLQAGLDRPHRPQVHPSSAKLRPVKLPYGTPEFIVTSLGGHGSVSASATGRVIAEIRPPVKGFMIEGIGAAPGDHVYVLAGQVFVGGQHPHGVVEFFRVDLGSNGKPQRAVRLPGPSVSLHPPVTSNGLINIPVALSYAGGFYAYAISRQMLGDASSVPATVTIVNAATGASHSWTLWPAERTQISELSFGIGRLGIVADIGDATVANGAIVHHRGDELSVLMTLRQDSTGHNLVADAKLLTFGWASESATGQSAVLDGPVSGVIGLFGFAPVQILTDHGKRSKLVEVSLISGQIGVVLLDSPRSARADPSSLDNTRLLFTLSPRHELPSGTYVCGHLALDDLLTAKIVQLPFPVHCGANWPGEPFIYAW